MPVDQLEQPLPFCLRSANLFAGPGRQHGRTSRRRLRERPPHIKGFQRRWAELVADVFWREGGLAPNRSSARAVRPLWAPGRVGGGVCQGRPRNPLHTPKPRGAGILGGRIDGGPRLCRVSAGDEKPPPCPANFWPLLGCSIRGTTSACPRPRSQAPRRPVKVAASSEKSAPARHPATASRAPAASGRRRIDLDPLAGRRPGLPRNDAVNGLPARPTSVPALEQAGYVSEKAGFAFARSRSNHRLRTGPQHLAAGLHRRQPGLARIAPAHSFSRPARSNGSARYPSVTTAEQMPRPPEPRRRAASL